MVIMTGFELRLWRKSLGWSRDRAAEELGVCLRSYKDYENASEVKRGHSVGHDYAFRKGYHAANITPSDQQIESP